MRSFLFYANHVAASVHSDTVQYQAQKSEHTQQGQTLKMPRYLKTIIASEPYIRLKIQKQIRNPHNKIYILSIFNMCISVLLKGLCHKILNCAGRKVYIKRLIKNMTFYYNGFRCINIRGIVALYRSKMHSPKDAEMQGSIFLDLPLLHNSIKLNTFNHQSTCIYMYCMLMC